MIQQYILPERLDSSAAPTLVQALLDRCGAPLELVASQVEVIGALAFEVIIAAQKHWQAQNMAFTVTQPSPRFDKACTSLGLQNDAPWRPLIITEEAI